MAVMVAEDKGPNVTVVYGSKHGATAEIAERVARVLNDEGLEALALDARDARGLGAGAYVIGSAIYYGRWQKSAAKFLKKNKEALAGRAVWLFQSGPTGEGDARALLQGWKYPKSLEGAIESITPRDIAVFHGMVDAAKLGGFEKMAVQKVEAPLGDFRDWAAIEAWAKGIAVELRA